MSIDLNYVFNLILSPPLKMIFLNLIIQETFFCKFQLYNYVSILIFSSYNTIKTSLKFLNNLTI